jgi:EAL domain-containing protein (putative c-di-GMP-specific phosphodiesterase class I)
VRLIVVGAQPASVLFSVETLAQAYGIDLLGTIAKPVIERQAEGAARQLCAAAAQAAATASHHAALRFAEVGVGLQQRQFEPFFQPKIELATGQVKGLETFARWRHPEHGVLGPASFIDALEQNNRIDFLDWSMIELSVERCRQLPRPGHPDLDLDQPVARDAGASELHPPDVGLPRSATACMPDYITFEMTESSVLTTDPTSSSAWCACA